MVKTPRARHSSRKREPVTIELGPDEVSRLSDSPKQPEPETSPASQSSGSPGDEEIIEARGSSDADENVGAATSQTADADGNGHEGPRTRSGMFDSWSDASSASAGDAPPPARPSGIGAGLAAGLAGGVVALALAGALQWGGLIPAIGGSNGDASLQSLRSEFDLLKQRVASFDQGAVDAATIKTAVAPIEKRIDALADELARLKADGAAAKSSVAGGSPDATELKEIQDRLAKLEQGLSAASRTAPSSEAVDALEQKVSALGRTAGGNNDALQKLQADVQALNKKVAEQAREPDAATAVAASALKSAIDSGGPFSAELDMFAAAAPDAPELAGLRRLAAKGVPTRPQLAGEVGPAAERMIEASRVTTGGDGDILDRLLDSARSLVKVRPVGDVAGDGIPARISRFRNAVTGGDLAGAVQEYNSLPEKVKAAGASFMADLQARLTVDQLAQKALAGALKKE